MWAHRCRNGALPVAGIVVSGRVRIACFARGHVLGPDQALDQFEFAVVADGGDAPGDGDILAPVDRAGLDRGFDLVEPRLVGIGFLDQFFGPAVVVHVGEFVVAGPQAFDLGLLPVRRLGRLRTHPPEAAVALQSTSSRASAHFQRVSSSLAATWRLSMASLFKRLGSSNQIPARPPRRTGRGRSCRPPPRKPRCRRNARWRRWPEPGPRSAGA